MSQSIRSCETAFKLSSVSIYSVICETSHQCFSSYIHPILSGGGSAGVRRRFLKGAVGGTVENGSVWSQHEASSWFLGVALRLRLGGSLRGLLGLLGRARGGGHPPLRDHLGRSRCLVVVVVLIQRRRERECGM